MEVRIGMLNGQTSDVIGNVEIEGIVAVSIDLEVLGIRSENLQRTGHLQGYLGLIRPQEHLDLVRPAAQNADVL